MSNRRETAAASLFAVDQDIAARLAMAEYDADYWGEDFHGVNDPGTPESNNDDISDEFITNISDLNFFSDQQSSQMNAMDPSEYPKVDDWRDIETDHEVDIRIDGARRDIMLHFQGEIDAMREAAKAFYDPSRQASVDELCRPVFDLIFGEGTEIFNIFTGQLGWSKNKFFAFLGTFLLQCAYKLPMNELYVSDFNFEGLPPRAEYESCWKDLATFGIPVKGERPRYGERPFWTHVEDASNETFRRIFLKHFKLGGKMLCALDDDKVKYAAKPRGKLEGGFKLHHHAASKCMGMVCNHMALTLSGLPLNICWEVESDTSTTCYRRMVKNTFSMGSRGENVNLTNIIFASDRGYWTQALLFGFLLALGADILGTVMRCAWFPFVYDTNLGEKDKRKDIPKKGHKASFLKAISKSGKKLIAQAFRTGTNKVVLTMTTLVSRRSYNFDLQKPSDAQWYGDASLSSEDRWKKGFTPLVDSNLSSELLQEKVTATPLTISQGRPEWWLMRSFAITSSTAFNFFKIWSRKQSLDQDQEETFRTFCENWLPNPRQFINAIAEDSDNDEEAGRNHADEAGGNRANKEGPDDDGTDEEDDTTNEPFSLDPQNNDLHSLAIVAFDSFILGNEEQLKKELNKNLKDVQGDFAAAVLFKIHAWNTAENDHDSGHSMINPLHRSKKDNVMDARKWIKSDVPKRKYLFLSETELKAKIRDLGGDSGTRKRLGLINLLAKLVEDDALGRDNQGDFDSGDDMPFLKALLESTFLRELKGENSKHCKLGHEMEEVYIKSLIRSSGQSTRHALNCHDYDLGACHLAGVAARASAPPSPNQDNFDWAVRTSIDGLIEEKTQQEIFGIECKCRAVGTTAQRAHEEELEYLRGSSSYPDWAKPRFYNVVFGDDDFKKLVTENSEALQLLHHAFTMKLKTVVMLVGNSISLMRAVFVQFCPLHLHMYKAILNEIYKQSLEWLYVPRRAEVSYSDNDIETTISSLKKDISMEAFKDHLALWRKMNFNPPSDLKYPIPPMARLIPSVCALWNAAKGGSDTISKLLALQPYQVPKNSKTPQVVAVARMIAIAAVLNHRLLQHLSAAPDIETYYSLSAYRHAANQRTKSFRHTLRAIRTQALSKILDGRNTVTFERRDGQLASTRARRQQEEQTAPEYMHSIGATPKKGGQKRKICPDAEAEVQHRDKRCTGLPVWIREEEGARRGDPKHKQHVVSCELCKVNRSSVTCALCHKSFCFSQINAANEAFGAKFYDVPFQVGVKKRKKSDGKSKKLVMSYSCFHLHHEQAVDFLEAERKASALQEISSNTLR